MLERRLEYVLALGRGGEQNDPMRKQRESGAAGRRRPGLVEHQNMNKRLSENHYADEKTT